MNWLSPGKNRKKRIAVTGANGFIGAHCVVALLEEDFEVVATVRDPTNTDKTQFLKDAASEIGKGENLTFGAGDLLKEGSYDDAFEGCWGVLHTAAAVELTGVADPYESVVKPAVDGTKNVTASVKKHSKTIERFINFSSIAAICGLGSPEKVFKDDDWNEWSQVENGDYYGYAKTQAEKAVWDDEELKSCVDIIASINPTVVLGPVLNKSMATTRSGSVALIRAALLGEVTLNWCMNYVDVRDCSKAALLAFTKDKEMVGGKRFLLSATTESISPAEFNAVVQKSHPEAKGAKAAPNDFTMNTMVFIGEHIPFLRGAIQYQEQWKNWDKKAKLDNSLSKTVLGLGEYRSLEEMCKDCADSIEAMLKPAGEVVEEKKNSA